MDDGTVSYTVNDEDQGVVFEKLDEEDEVCVFGTLGCMCVVMRPPCMFSYLAAPFTCTTHVLLCCHLPGVPCYQLLLP